MKIVHFLSSFLLLSLFIVSTVSSKAPQSLYDDISLLPQLGISLGSISKHLSALKANKYKTETIVPPLYRQTMDIYGKSRLEPLTIEKINFDMFIPETINSSVKFIKTKKEWILEKAATYSPVVYLHKNEPNYPITVEAYTMNSAAQLVYQKDHEGSSPGTKEAIIKPGYITPAAVYCLRNDADDTVCSGIKTVCNQQYGVNCPYRNAARDIQRFSPSEDDLFYDFTDKDATILLGNKNNKNFVTKDGVRTDPAYVLITETPTQVYIRYLLMYGYNAPYTIHIPLTPLPIVMGDTANFQNAHQCDIEHITLQFDKDTQELEYIYYGSHGTGETRRIDYQDLLDNDPTKNKCNVKFDNQTHVISYAAYGGHGNYPEEGEYVRIKGFANDSTQKGILWRPHYILMFQPGNSSFNPGSAEGLFSIPGTMGARGVRNLFARDWIRNATLEDHGIACNQDFCPPVWGQSMCTASTRVSGASIPDSKKPFLDNNANLSFSSLPNDKSIKLGSHIFIDARIDEASKQKLPKLKPNIEVMPYGSATVVHDNGLLKVHFTTAEKVTLKVTTAQNGAKLSKKMVVHVQS